MAEEYARPPYGRDVGIPEGCDWTSLTTRRGAELEAHYVGLLRRLGRQRGMLGQVFAKAQNKIADPAKLFRLIDMVDGTDWVMLGADVKGDIYEGLLERNAEDTKSGAGQYFTPRALIRAMVACVRPGTRQDHRRPCLWNGRVLPRRPRLPDRSAQSGSRQRPEGVPQARHLPWQRNRGRHASALPDEPAASRHRGDDWGHGGIARGRADLAAVGDVRLRPGQSTLREEKLHELHECRRRAGDRQSDLQPAGFLGDDVE